MPFELRNTCLLLQVFDMPASLRFYRDILGFRIVESAPPGERGDDFGWAWLRRDSADLMLNTRYDPGAERPPTRDPAAVAAHDDTILYIGCPDVDAVYEHLRAHGVVVSPPTIAPYGMKQLHLKDPDGFGLCFQWSTAADDAGGWEREIRALEEEARVAFLSADLATLDRLWVDGYLVNSPLDRVNAKEQILELLRTGRVRHLTHEPEIEQITRHGDIVIVMGHDIVTDPPDGARSRRRYTNIWQLRDGAWRSIGRHAHVVSREPAG